MQHDFFGWNYQRRLEQEQSERIGYLMNTPTSGIVEQESDIHKWEFNFKRDYE